LATHDIHRPFERDPKYYEDRAQGLLTVLADGAAPTIDQVRTWHPAFTSRSDESIRTAPFTIDDARLVYARQHGHDTWPAFMAHIGRLASGAIREPFMDVFDAGRREEWPVVQALLRQHPELLRARGTNGNTLLNLASSLVRCGAPDESTAASPALAPLRLLLDAGADPNQGNVRGWTPLHQAGYRNDPGMVDLLLGAGARADIEAHGTGGTPLAVALFWGHRQAATLLARAGILPDNLRTAAALGRLDTMERFFVAGRLTSSAGAARGFYRPHSGFASWRPTNDEQEILDEALVWAAKSGQADTLGFLVQRGARVNSSLQQGTPLMWAAGNGHLETMRWLLDHGADVDQQGTYGGHDVRGVTALHIAAWSNKVDAAGLLVERGANPALTDDVYHGTPAGWAAHAGRHDAEAFLRGLSSHDS
jgi:ankyrin repeat protein